MAQLNRRLIQLLFVLVALILVPGIARAQNKSAPKSAPAPHPSSSGGGSHPSSAGGAGHTTTNTGGHTTTNTGGHTTTTNTGGHTTTTTGGHTTTATGGHTTTTTGGHTTTATGGHTTTATGGHTTTTTTAGGKTTTSAAGGKTTTTAAGGKTTTTAAGGKTNTAAAGGKTNTSATGGKGSAAGAGGKGGASNTKGGASKAAAPKTVTTKSGATARVNSNGHVTQVHTAKGATINRNAHGGRTVTSEHVNAKGEHVRTVSTARGRGYVDHRYSRGGHYYSRRTYWDHGHRYAYGYRGYYYHGYCCYYGYTPAYYYGPAFYGWAYNPWAAPVAYSWGWGGAPWYGAYGYYFNPYPAYASAALWMTDYVISQNLQNAYAAQAQANANAAAAANAQAMGDYAGGGQQAENAGGGDSGGPALTPEVKQAIADEVRAQLEAEKAAAAAPQQPASAEGEAAAGGQQSASAGGDAAQQEEVPAALDPNHRTFIVATILTEQAPDGSDCSLSPGDVVTRIDDSPDDNKNVKVLISSSQKGDCHSGSQVAIAVDDLQEMHNHFREQLDQGLKTLAENQGKNGIPAGPKPGGRCES